MKKFLAIILAAITLLTFASCGAKEEAATLKDGTYHIERAEFDDHGWKEYVDVTVEGGKITAVEYDSLNVEDGHKKTEDEAYKEAYTGAGFETYPAATADALEADLIAKQDAAKVDTVAGATHSSDGFKELVLALAENMKNGDTAPVIY